MNNVEDVYREIEPSQELQHTIDCFWVFSNHENHEKFHVLPDGCTDLIFDLREYQAFVSGAMTTAQVRELTTDSELIGVRFKTEKFSPLSKIPLLESKNLRIELSQVVTGFDSKILDHLHASSTTKEKMNILETCIRSSIHSLNKAEDKLVVSIAGHIRRSKGRVNIRELAKFHYISLRQLERRFKNYVGLTAKEFSSIIRFDNTKKAIKSLPEKSLLEIACIMGFVDHSHMSHEFRRISGKNPSYFR